VVLESLKRLAEQEDRELRVALQAEARRLATGGEDEALEDEEDDGEDQEMLKQIKELERVMLDPEVAENQEYFVKVSNAYYISAMKHKQQQERGSDMDAFKVKGIVP
jgi:hypothetical protein